MNFETCETFLSMIVASILTDTKLNLKVKNSFEICSGQGISSEYIDTNKNGSARQ